MTDESSRRRGPGLAVAAGGVLVLAAAGAAGYAYHLRTEAEAFERKVRADAELAEEQKAWERARRQAAREELAAVPAGLVRMLPGVAVPPADAAKHAAALKQRILGVWRGGTREVEYRADGTFRDVVTGPGAREWAGTWTAESATGTRVLRVARAGGGPAVVTVTVEGDELIHDDGTGAATVLRKN